jgi:HEAT repeat protein
MKQEPLSEKLQAISSLKNQPLTDELRASVRHILSEKNNLVVAAGARVARSHGLKELIPELRIAYDRFLQNPLKTDKLCHAKLAIVDALDELGFDEDELFRTAARYVQREPVYGGTADTAIKLRVRAGEALSRLGSRDIFFILAGMLMDSEAQVRAGAARILSGLDDERSELLLRMRVLSGDTVTENFETYFAALLSLNPARSFPFVAPYLEDPRNEIAEVAALALGESRRPEAFGLLSACYRHAFKTEFRRVLITAIALLRSDEAADFLIGLIAEENIAQAGEILDALRIYRDREGIIAKAKETAIRRGDAALSRKAEAVFA